MLTDFCDERIPVLTVDDERIPVLTVNDERIPVLTVNDERRLLMMRGFDC